MSRGAHCRTLIAATLVVAATLQGQEPAAARPPASYRSRLLGVFDINSGLAIEDAQVTDVLSGTSARTTKTGTVSLVFLPDGGSLVKVQKLGFEPTTIMVAISPVDTVPFTVLLKPAAQALPTVVTRDSAPHHISPGLRAFEERRRLGFGRFVTEAELRKSDSRTVTNLVRQMGVKVECKTTIPIRCFATSSRSGMKSCSFEVYVDGAPVNPDDRNLENMQTTQFGGIEAYFGPATIPPEYNRTGSSCGVMLFWTRER